jgi:thioredoxin 1
LQAVEEPLGHGKVTWREVHVVDDIAYAVALGVLTPPSIAIDGALVFPTLPTANTLKDALTRRLEQRGKL